MIAESIDLLNTKGIQKVTRICDECGKRQLTNVKQILYGRKLRSSDIDLCFGCSNLGKYRKLPIGKKNGHWKHGLTYQGYRRVNINGQRMLIHTVVMEKHLGRKLEKGEGIHHIDLNKLNNNIANLWVYNGSQCHSLSHSSLQKCGYKLFRQGKIFFGTNGMYTRSESVV